MDKSELHDAIQRWLEEHEKDGVGAPPGRHVIPDSIEEILDTDTPEDIARKKVREFSERWGWVHDLCSAVYWYCASWFTADVMLGVFRAGYGLLVAGLLTGIIYSLYFATKNGLPVRTLPTIDELQRPASAPDDGSTHPMEGY